MNQRPKITPILPTVYGESLSYLELLGKVVEAINGYNEAFDNGLTDEITAWIQANYNELFFNATYDAERDTLVMSLAESLAAKEGNEPVSYFELAGQVLEIVDKVARDTALDNTNKITILDNRTKTDIDFSNTVLIGDSYTTYYGDATRAWTDRFAELAKITTKQVFGQNGLGFYATGGDYTGLLDFVQNKVRVECASPEDVTCAVVGLGVNDTQNGESYTDIFSGMKNSADALNSLFPNATIVYAILSSTFAPSQNLMAAAENISAVSNVLVVDVTDMLVASPFINQNVSEAVPGIVMQADATHPTDMGANILGAAIYTRLCGGKVSPRYQYTINSLNKNFIIENNGGRVYMQIGTSSTPVQLGTDTTILPPANIQSFRFLRFLYGHIGDLTTSSSGQLNSSIDGIGKLVMKSDGTLSGILSENTRTKTISFNQIEINLNSTRVKYGLSPFTTA